jgi:hypothetical protein
MNYLEKLTTLTDHQKITLFNEVCAKPQDVQLDVLNSIIRNNTNCEIGRKYNFSSINNYDDYIKSMPITDWNFYDQAVSRMKNGEQDILFSGKTVYLTITSGTTGSEKLIPESKTGASAKKLVADIRNIQLIQAYPDLLGGKFLPLSNSALLGYTQGGIKFGSSSGITTSQTNPAILKMNAAPEPIKQINDPKAANYALIRFAVEEDVRAITCNNAGRIIQLLDIAQEYASIIIDDIEQGSLNQKFNISNEIRNKLKKYLTPNPEKAHILKTAFNKTGELSPNTFWPNLKIIRCWLSGSVGTYAHNVMAALSSHKNKIIYVDAGYGASEAKFNIPDPTNGLASGTLATFSAFYEFIPLDNESTTLLAHQLENGKEYRLLISTFSGLYRYDMHDIIRVDGFTSTTPNIIFVSKYGDIANLCGEKLNASFLTKSCRDAAARSSLKLKHFAVVTDSEHQKYIFCLELEQGALPENIKTFSTEIDNIISARNIPYRTYRNQNTINHPDTCIMQQGWQNTLYADRMKNGASESQIKLPVVYTDIPHKELALI